MKWYFINSLKSGFTLIEIMIVVAILGMLIAIGVPGYLTSRNRSRAHTEIAHLKAITDNIAAYSIMERTELDSIIRLWPESSTESSPSSYIRKQLHCPVSKVAYTYNTTSNLSSCNNHGTETETEWYNM